MFIKGFYCYHMDVYMRKDNQEHLGRASLAVE